MTDAGLALASLIALLVIGRLAFKQAKKADDESKLDPK